MIIDPLFFYKEVIQDYLLYIWYYLFYFCVYLFYFCVYAVALPIAIFCFIIHKIALILFDFDLLQFLYNYHDTMVYGVQNSTTLMTKEQFDLRIKQFKKQLKNIPPESSYAISLKEAIQEAKEAYKYTVKIHS